MKYYRIERRKSITVAVPDDVDWYAKGDAELIFDEYAETCDYADEYTQAVLLDGRDVEHPIPAEPDMILDDNLEPVIEPEDLSEEEIISLKFYASKFDQGDGEAVEE